MISKPIAQVSSNSNNWPNFSSSDSYLNSELICAPVAERSSNDCEKAAQCDFGFISDKLLQRYLGKRGTGDKKKGEMCQIIFVVALKKDRQIEKLRTMCGLTNNLRQRAHEANFLDIKIGKNRKHTWVKIEKQVNKNDWDKTYMIYESKICIHLARDSDLA